MKTRNKVLAPILVGALACGLTTGCLQKVDDAESAQKTAPAAETAAPSAPAENTASSEAGSGTESSTSAAESTSGADAATQTGSGVVYVYNWGEYMDPEVPKDFEKETGIKVVYDEFETNEIMYPKVAAGAATYDLICPSDYMISKMIENDLLQPINFDHVPNVKNIDETYMKQSQGFDPGNN